VQDITAKEGERTRAEVQAAAAHKAGAKQRKDSAKGETERAKHAADLEAMKATFKVLSSPPTHRALSIGFTSINFIYV